MGDEVGNTAQPFPGIHGAWVLGLYLDTDGTKDMSHTGKSPHRQGLSPTELPVWETDTKAEECGELPCPLHAKEDSRWPRLPPERAGKRPNCSTTDN